MNAIILKTAARYLMPLLLLFSAFILLRGHYLPGGGFVGGLVAAIAFVLHALAFGTMETRKLLGVHPGYLLTSGLAVALLSSVAPVLAGKRVMESLWYPNPLPVLGSIGSPLFFDIGVYLVVVGVVLTIILSLTELSQR